MYCASRRIAGCTWYACWSVLSLGLLIASGTSRSPTPGLDLVHPRVRLHAPDQIIQIKSSSHEAHNAMIVVCHVALNRVDQHETEVIWRIRRREEIVATFDLMNLISQGGDLNLT